MNKKVISSILTLIICLSTASTTFGAPTKQPAKKPTKTSVNAPLKMSARELAIVKAYNATLDAWNLKHIKPYLYPKLTLTLPQLPSGTRVKILSPKYEKIYDAKKKAYVLTIKGLMIVCNGEDFELANITEGIYLKTSGKTIYAYDGYSGSSKPTDPDKLTESQCLEIEKWLVSTYGQEKADAILDLDSEDSSDTEN